MGNTEREIKNASLSGQLGRHQQQNVLNLAEIKRLLTELEGENSFDPQFAPLLPYFLIHNHKAGQAEEIREIMELWAQKCSPNRCAHFLYGMFMALDTDEEVAFEIIKGVVDKSLGFRIVVEELEGQIPILKKVLDGFSSDKDPSGHKISKKVLDYFLAKGAGADLTTVIDTEVEYRLRMQVPELFAIWKIVKEDSIKSSRELTEADGQKIAMCYLHCTKEGLSAERINKNKDWVLEFVLTPLSLQCLAASVIKDTLLKKI